MLSQNKISVRTSSWFCTLYAWIIWKETSRTVVLHLSLIHRWIQSNESLKEDFSSPKSYIFTIFIRLYFIFLQTKCVSEAFIWNQLRKNCLRQHFAYLHLHKLIEKIKLHWLVWTLSIFEWQKIFLFKLNTWINLKTLE